MTAYISHAAAFRAQSDFPVEAKIKVGQDIWTEGTLGARLYSEVLSRHPATIQKVIDKAATLDPPFTAKQVQGHLRWIFTAGQLEIDGKSYIVKTKPAKEPKAAKVEAKKPAKAKPEAKKPETKVAAMRKRSFVKTKKLAKAGL